MFRGFSRKFSVSLEPSVKKNIFSLILITILAEKMGLESGKTGHSGASVEVLWSAEHSGTHGGDSEASVKKYFCLIFITKVISEKRLESGETGRALA